MKYLIVLAFLFSFVGCEKDPYPSSGNLKDRPRGPKVERNKPHAIHVAANTDIVEGETGIIKMKVTVKKPGKPIVWVDNLPDGAVFSETEQTITWTPDHKAGNDPADPTIKNKIYTVRVNFKSTEDIDVKHQTTDITLNVIDKMQTFEIDASSSNSVSEGRTLEYFFNVSSLDYPNGPFKVFTEGMPANTQVVQIDDNRFKLVFKPDYNHVKLNDNPNPCSGNRGCLEYNSKIFVTDPANHETDKDIVINVNDVRREIDLVTPDTMQQGLDISFSINAVDPNHEVAPTIRIISGEPTNGEFTQSLVKDEENNSSVYSVSWRDIPLSMNGKTHRFRFEACVLASSTWSKHCDEESFEVRIKVKERKPPVFSRSSWPVGEIKYFKYNQSQTYTIYVSDGDSNRYLDNVAVKPKSMEKYVSFYNNKVEVQIDKPGIHSFSLVATSDYNVASAESFMFEVFEKDRSKTLYFTDSTRNDEVRFYRETMGDVQLVNPVLNNLNTRLLSGRENLILGTDILKDTNLKSEISKAMDLIDNVVVASPLVENMPKAFLEELQNDFRVSIMGRYSDIANTPELARMYFVVRDDFSKPVDKIRLKLNSTSESFNPLIFSIGVDRKNCQDVMDFTNKGEVQGSSLFKIGIICDRKYNRGRIAILGTEFSDLKTFQADEKVPARWLRQMLSTRLDGKKGSQK